MEKYGTLKTLAAIIKFIAWLNLISGGILIIYSISEDLGIIFTISSLICGLIGFILLLSFSKLILLAIDIREEQIEFKEPKSVIKNYKKTNKKVEEISDTSITDIRKLIIKQKQSLLGNNKIKSEIISLLNSLATSERNARLVIEKYEIVFEINIIDDLKNLSKNYSTIKEYLLPFIEFKVVREEFPHELIEK